MLVSTDFPFLTAATDAPFPKWQLMILRLSKGISKMRYVLSVI